MKQALLVNLSAPEMDRLAVELARRGALRGLVRRYANKQRVWERLVQRLPVIGKLYGNTLGRRVPPAGLPVSLILEAGVVSDFICAMVARLSQWLPELAGRWGKQWVAATEAGVADAGGRYLTDVPVVVASYHVALPAFKAASAIGCRKILNYPIAHHAWQYRLYDTVAKARPQFAAALPHFENVAAHAALLDAEIALADLILVGSHFVRDTFVSSGVPADKLRVVPYGADPGRFTPRAAPKDAIEPFTVLFVGQVGERKGISHLLAAYEQFRKPDTQLHLVGNAVQGAEVYAPWRHLYKHTPNVPQAQLPQLMQSADVFVLPTLVEGMPMVVIEAMACGLPVIVTAHGPSEVVRDGIDGIVVPVGDSAALLAALELLYTNTALREQMSRNAIERAAYWTWHRYAHAAADIVLAD